MLPGFYVQLSARCGWSARGDNRPSHVIAGICGMSEGHFKPRPQLLDLISLPAFSESFFQWRPNTQYDNAARAAAASRLRSARQNGNAKIRKTFPSVYFSACSHVFFACCRRPMKGDSLLPKMDFSFLSFPSTINQNCCAGRHKAAGDKAP